MKDCYKKFNNLSQLYENKIFHCYDGNKDIDVFLEDYVYFCLLLLTIYEFENDKSSLKKCESLMNEAWNNFFNHENDFVKKIRFNLMTFL